MNTTRGHRKRRVGVVVSDKMDKTVVVEVTRTLIDQTYKKVVRKKKRYKAHDEENQYKMGDRVTIMETRPLSRDKRWRIVSSLS
jgi:small subunit ribosomal protein S17